MNDQKTATPQQLLDLLYSVAIEATVQGKRTLMAQLAYTQLSEILSPKPAPAVATPIPSKAKLPVRN